MCLPDSCSSTVRSFDTRPSLTTLVPPVVLVCVFLHLNLFPFLPFILLNPAIVALTRP